MLWVELVHIVKAAEAKVISRSDTGSAMILIADKTLQLR